MFREHNSVHSRREPAQGHQDRPEESRVRMSMVPCCSKHHLPAIERLRVSPPAVRFDDAHTHQREKGVFREPMFVPLAAVAFHDVTDLPPAHGLVEIHIEVGYAEISIVLWDLVLKDEG